VTSKKYIETVKGPKGGGDIVIILLNGGRGKILIILRVEGVHINHII
jgi:hypothetical protein